MARFTSLSQAVKFHVAQQVQPVQVGQGTTLAVQLGQNLPLPLAQEPESGVQRWGFSTWGVEPITGVYRPEDEKPPVTEDE
jgi:hypothetical protein